MLRQFNSRHGDPGLTPEAGRRIGCCKEKVPNRVPRSKAHLRGFGCFSRKDKVGIGNSDSRERMTIMPLINVSVINACSVLADSDVQPVVDALQKQVDNDFGPAWGVAAKLNFVPQGGSPPAGSWWLLILDDSDQAGALGYHDLTSEGFPLGRSFAATTIN